MLDSNIIYCSQDSTSEKPRRASVVSALIRRRALSEPSCPNFRARIHRLFEPRVTAADPDVEHAGEHHVVVVHEDEDEYARGSQEEREKDAAEKEYHRAVVEDMYEHTSASRSLLSQPAQAYRSMMKRSDQSLRQHLTDSQVEVRGLVRVHGQERS